MANNHKQPAIFAIFGAGGDLSKRKLLPALYNLYLNKLLPEKFCIIGLARDCDIASFRDHMRGAVEEFSRQKIKEQTWEPFAANIHFICGEFGDDTLYKDLAAFISKMEKEWEEKAVRAYYLSVPPTVVEMISMNLDRAHLSGERRLDRIVIEKPFGHDL